MFEVSSHGRYFTSDYCQDLEFPCVRIMRLLHSAEARFADFSESRIPAYAILSHRWSDSEVSFQELQHVLNPDRRLDELLDRKTPSLDDEKYAKIQKCRAKAVKQNLQWIWIDTCCINKDSSAELSEAINSMYRWYECAAVCFVYMSDVHRTRATNPQEEWEKDDLGNFLESKWFTRGWTLQELLAPRDRVLFYDADWEYLGDRNSLAELIAERTRIDVKYLRHSWNIDQSILTASVAMRMSWVSRRNTSRPEDMAYCLLGLFDVNMPLLYGEGKKAFVRLQMEIIKKNDDESIFAWRRATKQFSEWERGQVAKLDRLGNGWFVRDRDAVLRGRPTTYSKHGYSVPETELASFSLHSGLLAQEPVDFVNSGQVKPYPLGTSLRNSKRQPYSMTNRGLLLFVDVYPSLLSHMKSEGDVFDVPLNCYDAQSEIDPGILGHDHFPPVVISLRKEVTGEDQHWRRHECRSFQGPYKEIILPGEEKVQTAFYIRQDGL